MRVIQRLQEVATTSVFSETNETYITTFPSTTVSSTLHYYDPTNSCGCKNRGICLAPPEGFPLCECEFGFEGELCEDIRLVLGSSYQDKPSAGAATSSMTSTIAFVSIAALFLVVCFFVFWRKYRKSQERRNWVRWQETRRQSKATIEGLTIVDTTSSSDDTPLSVIRKQSQIVNAYTNVAMSRNEEAKHVHESRSKTSENKQKHLPITV